MGGRGDGDKGYMCWVVVPMVSIRVEVYRVE